ncbi:MAG TPA: hypothetical protein VGK74_03800 [Symbiobacteriaceae bacterium]
MSKIGPALRVTLLASIAMELFLRLTDLIFHHNVNPAWQNGTSLGLDPNALTTLVPGYLMIFAGGFAFVFLYQRFMPVKNAWTGILYMFILGQVLIGGLILMPLTGLTHPLVRAGVLPAPGLLGLNYGAKAFLFNALAHGVFGAVLGLLSRAEPHRVNRLAA